MNVSIAEVHRLWLWVVYRLMAWLVLAVVIGLIVDQVMLALLVVLGLYILIHLVFLYQLHRWLAVPKSEPRGAIGVWAEIYTALYLLRQHSRRRERRLKNIIDEFQASTAALPDGTVVVDDQGRINWFNQAAATLLGLRPGQDNGQRLTNLVRDPGFIEFTAVPHQPGASLEFMSPANAQQTLTVRIVPYGNGQRLLLVRDVSEEKRLEVTRRDFVANASHELRTPLTVMRGYLEMMSEETTRHGQLSMWRQPILEMAEQSKRMGQVINGLLRLARLEQGNPSQPHEIIDMPVLIQRLVGNFRASNKGRHIIEVDLDDDLTLLGKPAEIESVISNLISNALRYTPKGGRVTVSWKLQDGMPQLAVSDDGPGIPSEHLPRLTERFYRVDVGRNTQKGGTGLGLAIVKHALEHHKTKLKIDSQPGHGSVFYCQFPPRERRPAIWPSQK